MVDVNKLYGKHNCVNCGKCRGNCEFKRFIKEHSQRVVKQELKPIVKKLIKPIIKSMIKSLTPLALRQDLTFEDILLGEPWDPYREETIKLEELKRERFKPYEVDEYFNEVRFVEHGMWYYITWLFTRVFPGRIHYFVIGYKELENGELMVFKLFALVEDRESGFKTLVNVPNYLASIGLLPPELSD
jgi:ferredoxin